MAIRKEDLDYSDRRNNQTRKEVTHMLTIDNKFNVGDAVRLKVDNTGASIGAIVIVMWDGESVGYQVRKRDGATYYVNSNEIEIAEQD